MPRAPATSPAHRAIVQLCASGLPSLGLLRQVAAQVRRAVPYAAGGWFCTDPATLFFTTAFVEDVPPNVYLSLFDNELFGQDFARFDRIARSRRRATSLLRETDGDLERSPRHKEIYRPNGWQGEIRTVFRSGPAVLGVGCFTRNEGAAAFGVSDLAFVEEVADVVGEGLRRALVVDRVAAGTGDAPGMIVLGPDDAIQSMTEQARRLLEEMVVDAGTRLELPSVVYQAAHVARGCSTTRDARARVRLASGRWLLVHASRLIGLDTRDDRVAVVLQPAMRSQLTALIVELYGLTRRESEVTELLVRGRTIEDIAHTLSISRYTVRDYVKAIFGKLGVSSRHELTAKLVYAHVAAPRGER